MNRADAMLAVLRIQPEDWWSRGGIFAHAGDFFLTNNAASELRARGYDVQHKVIRGKHYYRLLSDSRANPSVPAIAEHAVVPLLGPSPAACSTSEQLVLA